MYNYMRVQNYWFWQGQGITRNSTLVDLVSRTIFWRKLAAILDFEPLCDQEIFFEQFYHILHHQTHIFRGKNGGTIWPTAYQASE